MQQIFIELSKYIFAFLIAFYTLASYQGAVMQNEQKRGKIYFIAECINVYYSSAWISDFIHFK